MARVKPGTRRWLDLAAETARELPGQWSVRGGGLKAALVRGPFEWTLPWIGFEEDALYSHAGLTGRFVAGVSPLVEHEFQWLLTFGVRMADLGDGPREVDLEHPGAAAVLREFAIKHAIPTFDHWTVERIAERCERQTDKPLERRTPPHRWLGAPGFRVVLGTGSPEALALDAIEFGRERQIKGMPEFYQSLLDAWRAGGRPAALSFLEADRDRKLAGQKLDAPVKHTAAR